MQQPVQIVLCTCPDEAVAINIASRVVEEDLAACVNVVPGLTSVFLWQEKLVKESEFLLIMKTTEARYPQLEERVEDLHPYDVPEILALPVTQGLENYLDWVRRGGD